MEGDRFAYTWSYVARKDAPRWEAVACGLSYISADWVG